MKWGFGKMGYLGRLETSEDDKLWEMKYFSRWETSGDEKLVELVNSGLRAIR